MATTWNDQPPIVSDMEILVSLYIGDKPGRIVEVRSANGWVQGGTQAYFVTVGNLFGSQTVRCENANLVFKVMKMAKSRKKQDLPTGVTLLDAPEKSAK